MSKFPSILKDLRNDNGYNQTKLADFLGVTYFTIGKWENGKAEPNLDTLNKLADFFDVSVDYLIGRENDLGIKKYSAEHNNRAALSEDESELLKNFRKLGPFARESIIIQVNALAEKNEDRQKTF